MSKVNKHFLDNPDPRTDRVRSFGIGAYACHPLTAQGRVIGTLSFGACSRNSFTADELALMKTVADQVSIAMERKRLSESLGRINEELEQMVQERTEQLESAVVELEVEVEAHQQVEAELVVANRALRTLSACNDAVLHATEELQLMESVCRAIVETGGYRIAWVGLAERDEAQSVTPVAHAGDDEGYLDTVKVTWADTARGRGPTGTAVRAGQVRVMRNMQVDPHFLPWREEAHKRGYSSSIALPLRSAAEEERVFGALTIYAAETDAFDATEEKLLTELADHLAYGIGALRAQTRKQQAEEALRESEERYRLLFERNLAGVFRTAINPQTLATRRLEFNDAHARILGYESREDLLAAEVPQVFGREVEGETLLRRMLEEESLTNYEACFRRKDGSPVWVLLNVGARSSSEHGWVAEGTMIDITDRKRAEEALQISEQQYRALFEKSPYPMSVYDRDTLKYLGVNDAAVRHYGYSRDEFLNMTLREIRPPEGLPLFHERLGEALRDLAETESTHITDIRHRKKDGSVIDVEITLSQIDFKGSRALLAITTDVTERKRAREAQQVFARRLVEAQEEERGRIARELHDELGQSLTALHIMLQTTEEALQDSVESKTLKQCVGTVERLLQQVRSMSLDLRPSMLDDIGLASALRWYVDRQGQLAGFVPSRKLESREERLPSAIETALFRIGQEAVTNIVRHAKARNVRVELHQEEEEVELVISDDGIGFDAYRPVDTEAHRPTAGLTGMYERVLLLNGQFEVDSTPGEGTEIRARLPVKRPA